MPDFGSFRGFGEKLTQGQTPTQLGLIGTEDIGIDPDVQAFFDRVTNSGGTLSTTEQIAVNTLVFDMKAAGIWSAMKAIYPMVGASAAACAQNLKSSSFTGTFNGGWTFSSNGIKGDGTTAYMNTQLNMLNNLNQNNTHIMVYSRDNIEQQGVIIGAAISLNNGCYIYPKYTSTIAYFSIFNTSGGNGTATISSSSGFLLASRRTSTAEIYYQNSTKITTNSQTSQDPASLAIYIGANNNNGNAVNYSSLQTALASIGDGLTDTQAADFYTAVQAFQTTLGRQV